MKYIVLDCETQRLGDLKRGEPIQPIQFKTMGLSVMCVYVSWECGGRYMFFDRSNLVEFEEKYRECDFVVTFNGKNFDIPLIENLYCVKLPDKKHVDLMDYVVNKLGFFDSLERVGIATLNRGKTGKGSSAPDLYNYGLYPQLYTYCLDDVNLTKAVFEYALENNHFYCQPKHSKKPVKVPFSIHLEEVTVERPTLKDCKPKYVSQANLEKDPTPKQILTYQSLIGDQNWFNPDKLNRGQVSKLISLEMEKQ